jgi:hypothetical protein
LTLARGSSNLQPMLSSTTAQRLLALWLRLGGVTCTAALVAVVMPRNWHAAAHAWLGLGGFPDAPIVEYLARGMSGMCGLYGLLLLWLARDVVTDRRLIAFLLVTLMAMSLAATLSIAGRGMPRWWLYGDVGAIWAFGVVTLLLLRAIGRPADGVSRGS